MVQRSYNAFAVRVQDREATKRKVVPASLSSEGELCIEMRIRIYPDGAMSNLLLQLVKVQHQGGGVANLPVTGPCTVRCQRPHDVARWLARFVLFLLRWRPCAAFGVPSVCGLKVYHSRGRFRVREL